MLKHLYKTLCIAAAIAVAMPAFSQLKTVDSGQPIEGVVRVKLQTETARKIGSARRVAPRGKLSTGTALDAPLKAMKGVSIRPVFPPNEKFAAQRAEFGLDQWFEIEFDSDMSSREAAGLLKSTAGVSNASVRYPVVLFDGNARITPAAAPTAAATQDAMPFNDPRLSQQWHYHNTGQRQGWVPGADINLFDAWQTETGKSDVIVAIIDGGVDYTHEDLAANMWVNEAELNGTPGVDDDGNGYVDDIYGYNFVTNSAQIYPHNHGTHVAGTVAAVNNNGIGVAGVAGGDGTPGSGVRLMSCQVFESRAGTGEGNFAAALVYAAEMGASIAQCSWGWDASGYYDPAVIDAIGYFNRVSRSDRMNGGLCIFASGNQGSTGDIYPGCLDNVLTVGAMTAQLTPASYTNYGSWVDVVAPGGLLDFDQSEGVLSTLPNNSYGFMEGTSMACPHVSGIAALILSKHGNANFPPSTLRTQIETSVRDFYTTNPTWVGLLGSGYVDAARALNMSDGTAPEAVASYEAIPTQDEIALSWIIPESSDHNVNHHTIYYSTTEFNAQSDLQQVPQATVDTRFMQSGDPMTYDLTGLQAMTSYWVAIKAVDRWGNASPLSEVKKVTTNAGPKMTLTAGESSFQVTPTASTAGSFTIGNEAEGLLRWSTSLRNMSMSMFGLGRMQSSPYRGTIALAQATPRAKSVATYDVDNYMASDYPKSMQTYEELYAYIGDADKTKPNALAQLFTVDASAYPNGFNLTHLNFDGANGSSARFEIYRGNSMFSERNLELRFEPQFFAYNYDLSLPEQLWFAPGESFWVVAHISGEDPYPLGMGFKNDSPTALSAYMSNDGGKTWTLLAEALKGSMYEQYASSATWCVKAMSKNPDWSQVLELTPATGTLKQNETAQVEVKHNGTPLVNGNYKAKVYVTTNETTPSADNNLTFNFSVSGQTPDIQVNKVIDFGSLLVGQKKTIPVEILNEGYGTLGGQYNAFLGSNNITSTDPNFKGPDYVQSGFPARSATTVDLTFEPVESGSHSGQIVFKGATGEFKVMVTGAATDPANIAFNPATLDAGQIVAGEQPKELEFEIRNDGKYPLEFVMPNYSDQTLSTGAGASSVHRFGYTADNNITGSVAYEPMAELADGKEVTSQLNDRSVWSNEIEIGFGFPYFGKTYERLYISKFGGVAFSYEPDIYMYGPLTTTSNGVAGTGLICAYGISELVMGAQSKVVYGHKDGNFVVNFQNVLAAVYGTEYIPISFHLTLSPTGDVYMAYDDYDPWSVFTQGEGIFVALNDMEMDDPFIVTSQDMVQDGIATVATQIATGTAFHFSAPKPNIISSVSPAYGMVAPGDKVTVKATVAATDEMAAGATYTNLVVNSNDPQQPSAVVRFDAVVGGDLKPELTVKATELNFGKVFRTATKQLAVTVSNTGRNDMTLTDATLADGKFTIAFDKGAVIPARQSRDIVVTLPTETEGAVSDVLTITTDAGTARVSLTGQVIGVPAASLSYESIMETLAYGATKAMPLTVTNTGNEPLEWSLTPGAHLLYTPAYAEGAKVSYTYASSLDDKSVSTEWIDIVSGGKASHNNTTYFVNNDFVEVDLPFEFPFYGKKYTKMYVYGRGFVSFTKRTDEHTAPEPPAEFPLGTIYDNLIAPYWGLHFPDENRTSGVYTLGSESEMVVSFMEYGNTMNYGIDYQLVMYPDGSFRFAYKGHDENAELFNIFGVAGISNEGATSGMAIPERTVSLGQAVQFNPMVVNTLPAGESATADVTLTADAMGGEYESALTLSTNVPTAETITVPVSLTIEGTPKPEIPEKVEFEFIAGSMSTDYSDFFVQQGVAQVCYIDIKNTGSAAFTIENIATDIPMVEFYDDYFGETYEMPAFDLWYYGKMEDWMTGEMVDQWIGYGGDYFEPATVDANGFRFAIPIMPGSPVHAAPGVTNAKLTLMLSGVEGVSEVEIPITITATDVPVLSLDKFELTYEGVADDFEKEETITLGNDGAYKLTYDYYIDTTGEGEEAEIPDGGGIAPMAAKAAKAVKAPEAISLNKAMLAGGIRPFDTEASDNYLNVPQDGNYTGQLYHPVLEGSQGAYVYGSNTTYSEFYGSTLFESPKGGFNISHIYTLVAPGNLENVDYTVEIVLGDDPTSGTVAGRGTYHLDESPFKGTPGAENGTAFIIVPLDRPVFVGEGSQFCVVVKYPVGEKFVAGMVAKADPYVSNRYMAYLEGYGWYDAASMFEEKYGSLGYATTCLQTTEGSFWVSLSPDATTQGVIEPEATTPIKVKINAATAPLETGNKAMIVVHTSDPMQPVVNIPVTLSKNATPTVTTTITSLEVNEGETGTLPVKIDEPDGDALTVSLTDNGHISTIESVDAGTAAVTIADDRQSFTVAGSTDGTPVSATANVKLAPTFGDAGTFNLTVNAADAHNHVGTLNVAYVVNHTNRAPVAGTAADVALTEGQVSQLVAFDSMFTDPDGDPMTFTLDVTDAAGVVEPYLSNNGVIFFGKKAGEATATVTATDSEGAQATASFAVKVDKSSGIESISASAAGITLAPAVTSDLVTLTCAFTDQALGISVVAMNGQVLMVEQMAVSEGQPVSLSLGHLPAGNYLLTATTSAGSTAAFRIIRE